MFLKDLLLEKLLTVVNDEPAHFLGLIYRRSFMYNTELIQLSSCQKDPSNGAFQSQQRLHGWASFISASRSPERIEEISVLSPIDSFQTALSLCFPFSSPSFDSFLPPHLEPMLEI